MYSKQQRGLIVKIFLRNWASDYLKRKLMKYRHQVLCNLNPKYWKIVF